MEKEKGVYRLKVETSYDFTQEELDDILCTAFEGGITYWCEKAYLKGGEAMWNRLNALPKPEGHWDKEEGYFLHEAVTRGFTLEIYPDDEDVEMVELNLCNFTQGLKMYIENYGRKLDHDDICGMDAYGADAVVQYAVFGELVYG